MSSRGAGCSRLGGCGSLGWCLGNRWRRGWGNLEPVYVLRRKGLAGAHLDQVVLGIVHQFEERICQVAHGLVAVGIVGIDITVISGDGVLVSGIIGKRQIILARHTSRSRIIGKTFAEDGGVGSILHRIGGEAIQCIVGKGRRLARFGIGDRGDV